MPECVTNDRADSAQGPMDGHGQALKDDGELRNGAKPKSEGDVRTAKDGVARGEDGSTDDKHTQQMLVALEALRARRAELRDARAELDTLREQLQTAQADVSVEREGKEFAESDAQVLRSQLAAVRAELDLMAKAKAGTSADMKVVQAQLGAARAGLEEERVSVKRLTSELEEERKARSKLSSDIERLQQQLISLGDGLKKLQFRMSTASSELEETRRAKAEAIATSEALRSELSAVHVQLKEMESAKSEVEAVRLELEDQLKVSSNSHLETISSLKAQLASLHAELASSRDAGLLLLADARTELEIHMKAAWHNLWEELQDAPHRTHQVGPPILRASSKVRKPRSARDVRVSFAAEEHLAHTLSVTSYRDQGEQLWFTNPESDVQCDRCEARGPQTQGRMSKIPGVSQFMFEEFLCYDCHRNDAMASFLQPAWPRSSPVHDQSVPGQESSSESSSSAPPRSCPSSSSGHRAAASSRSGAAADRGSSGRRKRSVERDAARRSRNEASTNKKRRRRSS